MIYEVVSATQEHGQYIATYIRDADRAEIWAAHHVLPHDAIALSLAVSGGTGYTGMADGIPVCLYGVAPGSLVDPAGRPWLLGTNDVPYHSVKFLRESKRIVNEMREQFGNLYNYVDARNTVSIRWLSWLGFDIYEALPYGIEQRPFHLFTMGDPA